jgi:hypothetical protein
MCGAQGNPKYREAMEIKDGGDRLKHFSKICQGIRVCGAESQQSDEKQVCLQSSRLVS